MIYSTQSLFLHHLGRLEHVINKIPENVFSCSLSEDMFCLAVQAKIACNFMLRGYCPLVGLAPTSFDQNDDSKAAITEQIKQTISYLGSLKDVIDLDSTSELSDKAGFAIVTLPQPEFIHHYILPNFFFHLSMVYAIARAEGVPLTKGDYDGLHQYPNGFSFS